MRTWMRTYKRRYQILVEKLIYLTHRLCFAYPVNVVNQLMHDPNVRHLQVIKHVLQYLEKGILFKRGLSITRLCCGLAKDPNDQCRIHLISTPLNTKYKISSHT